MPLVLEDDAARLANGFDPASANTLYWKQVPVLVKQHDREDQTEQLTFRILSGVTRQNHSLRVSWVGRRDTPDTAAEAATSLLRLSWGFRAVRSTAQRSRLATTKTTTPLLQVLRIHVSSEEDPYFLHTLEVTEDDFQCLKADQGILVDFASFPGKIISLLERCIGSHSADNTPRFQAVLSCRHADSTLKIVETNDFKQLAHITLAFKPGNDFTVKQVCAGVCWVMSEVIRPAAHHLHAVLSLCFRDSD